MKPVILARAGALATLSTMSTQAAVPTKADVVVIMDESGSMSGEQAWIPGTIAQLDSGLIAAGLVGGNRYELVGFGANVIRPPTPGFVRSFAVGSGTFGTAAQFGAAAAGLVTSGITEDGWAGINLANTYSFDPLAADNFILVTDEDRDNSLTTLTYAAVLASMTSTNTLLNAVINGSFRCGDRTAALGMIGDTGCKVGAGGTFTTCTGASFVSGSGTTGVNYVDLAIATGGGAWNLNILRSGGNNAASFTNAFISGKLQEIATQPTAVPEPQTYLLMLAGLGLVGFVSLRRSREVAG